MLKRRVIPALLLSNGGLVKTRKFKRPKYIGDPVNTVRIFNEKEVDELMILDIDASKKALEPDLPLIEEIASECFMPLTYGGGIRTIEQAADIFSCGVEKISIQTSALEDINFIRVLADRFGSQSIICSVDIKRNWFGRPQVFSSSKNKVFFSDWLKFVSKITRFGVGEILINAIDKDGTLSGPDLELIRQASECVDVPIIALGGVASLLDIKAAVDAGASAVAAGSFFVFHGPHEAVVITYPNYDDLELLFEGKTNVV